MLAWPELTEDQKGAYIVTNYNDLRTLTEAIALSVRRCGQVGIDVTEEQRLEVDIEEMKARRELIQAKYNSRAAAGVLIRPPSDSEVEVSQERAEQTASLRESKQDVALAIAFTVAALESQHSIQPESLET